MKKDTGEIRCANWIFEELARADGAVGSIGRILPVTTPLLSVPLTVSEIPPVDLSAQAKQAKQ